MKIKAFFSTTFIFTSIVCTSLVSPVSAQNAIIRSSNPNARINLRYAPTTNSQKLGYGLVGDGVTVLEQTYGRDGYTWYKVQFPRSKAIGWIRGDFISLVTPQPRQSRRNKPNLIDLCDIALEYC